MVHPIAQKYPGLVNQIYNGFASREYLNKTYITVDDCAAALVQGCNHHQGKGDVKRFLCKTISRIDKRSAKTHIGTFAQLNAITTQKVKAAQALANTEKQRAAEKKRLEARLSTLGSLRLKVQTSQKALVICQQTIIKLNKDITNLKAKNPLSQKDIDQLKASIVDLETQTNHVCEDTSQYFHSFKQWQNPIESPLSNLGLKIKVDVQLIGRCGRAEPINPQLLKAVQDRPKLPVKMNESDMLKERLEKFTARLAKTQYKHTDINAMLSCLDHEMRTFI
jgi:DNA repair exonuclease SbcCD ATPase subunit